MLWMMMLILEPGGEIELGGGVCVCGGTIRGARPQLEPRQCAARYSYSAKRPRLFLLGAMCGTPGRDGAA